MLLRFTRSQTLLELDYSGLDYACCTTHDAKQMLKTGLQIPYCLITSSTAPCTLLPLLLYFFPSVIFPLSFHMLFLLLFGSTRSINQWASRHLLFTRISAGYCGECEKFVKNRNTRWLYETVGNPEFHFECLSSSLSSASDFSLLLVMHCGRKQEMTQVDGAQPPVWEAWTEFPGTALPWFCFSCCEHLGEWIIGGIRCCLSVCLFLCVLNKQEYKIALSLFWCKIFMHTESFHNMNLYEFLKTLCKLPLVNLHFS